MSGDRGLAAERTALAWSRTSLAFLANGGLLLLRHVTGSLRPVHVALAVAASAIAAMVILCGRVRVRQVQSGGRTPRGPSTAMVFVLGFAVAIFGALVTVSLLAT